MPTTYIYVVYIQSRKCGGHIINTHQTNRKGRHTVKATFTRLLFNKLSKGGNLKSEPQGGVGRSVGLGVCGSGLRS